MNNSNINISAIGRWLIVGLAILYPILNVIGALDSITWLENKQTSVILFILGIIMAYMIDADVRASKTNTQIKNSIDLAKSETIAALNGVEVISFDNSDLAFLYLEDAIRTAKKSIDQVAIAKTPGIQKDQLSSYLEGIVGAASNRQVHYRYAFGNNFPDREKRLKSFIDGSYKYNLGRLNTGENPEIPLLNFAIFDSEIVFMRYPNESTGKEIYIAVKNKSITEMFQAYFKVIWNSTEKIC